MTMKIVAVLSSFFFLGLGLLIGLVEIIALLDPVGTKMADDADPFGNPYRPWYVHACYFFFAFVCLGISFLLLNSLDRTNPKFK